jgi:amino acid transporter/nucleotide-binding universal stress UspA family protein
MATEAGPSEPGKGAAKEIDLAAEAGAHRRGVASLGPVLAWAIVFADLGTSIYYVPGILFGQVGGLASAFVIITTVAFVLVAAEHLEVAHRYPSGGGGVAAAQEAFGPRVAVVSGALMVSAYLIAIALTVVTAMHYIAAAAPPWAHRIGIFSIAGVIFVGFASWVGVRGVARMTLVVAVAALAAHVWILVAVVARFRPTDWADLITNVEHLKMLHWTDLASGFAAAWLSYSGLESLAQLAPALREPRQRVIRVTTALVVGSVLVTVPVFTAVAVEAATASRIAPQGALLAAVALDYGGRHLQLAVCVTGAVLLLLAAKVAFLGCYNVFQAIGELGYLPAAVAKSHVREEAPRGAVITVTVGALALVLGTGGDPRILAQLFAFGLLGSYTITSISLGALRWRERRRGAAFLFGVVATLALAVPWVTSWFTKWTATAYGAAVTGLLLLVALVTHRGWIRSGRFGFLTAAAAEQSAADLSTAVEVLTLGEAVALKQSYPSTTMLALRGANPSICQEAAKRARGMGDTAVYVVYVDEIPGLLFPPRRGPSGEALRVLRMAVTELRTAGMDAVPIWRLAHDAGASLADTAEELGASCVFIGTAQRSAVWHFLQGSVLKRLIAELPENIHVVICQ